MYRIQCRTLTAISCVLGCAAPGPAAAGPAWEALSEVGVVRVISHDEDGESRETKVWFAVVDGQGFIRTGSSRWGDNLERDPDLVLRFEGQDHALRADFIRAPELRGRVGAAFREKYGCSDAFIGIFRGGAPRIIHMLPR